MNPESPRQFSYNAVAHTPVVALLTFYFVGLFLIGILIMAAILLLLRDLAEGIRHSGGGRERRNGIWPKSLGYRSSCVTGFLFWLTRNYWVLWFLALSFRWSYSGPEDKS